MQEESLSKDELSDETLSLSDLRKIAGATVIYAILLTLGTTICIWVVDFRAKGTFSTIRGENITQSNS